MYFGRVTPGHGLVLETVKIVDTLAFEVCWRNETDGKVEVARRVATLDAPITKAARERAQAKLDDMVRRYESYAKWKGKRFEVVEREKRERKRRIERAPGEAMSKVVNAAVGEHKAGKRAEVVFGEKVRQLDIGDLATAATALLTEIRFRAETAAKKGSALVLPTPSN